MSDNLQTALLAALSDAMQPLIEVGGDPAALRALFEDAGWSTDFPEGFPDPALVSAIGELADAVSDLVDAVTPPPDSLELLKEAVTKGAAVYRALKKLAPGLTAGGIDPGEVDDLLIQVLDLLIVRYLQVRWPAAYHVARLVGVIEDGVNGTTTPSSTAGTRPRVHFERVPDLVERPAETLRSLYLTAENVNDRVQALSTLVLPVLESLLRSLGVQSVVGLDPGQDLSLSPGAMDAATRTLTAYFPVDPGTAGIALSVGAGAPGVQVTAVPFGNLSLDTQGDTWQATLTAAASTPGVTLDATGVSLPSGHEGGELNLQFILKSVQPDGIVLLGADESTRLQAAGVAVVIEGKFSADTLDFRIAIRLGKAGLAVTSGNGDGFLQSILPSQLGSTFDVEVGYQRSTGVFLGSSPSLEETLPVDYVLGPLTFSTVRLFIQPAPQRLSIGAAANISVQLGPVVAGIEGVGVVVDMFLNGNRDASSAPLTAQIRFKPPDGVNLEIDAGVVVGGGYLFFDTEKEQYAGAVHLELAETLSLTAFGLLTTRMPDGSPGFSLLVLIAATFSPPIQLGYGFTLSGIGGLVGVNRTIAVDTLRTGLRTGSLGSVLFPTDPIRNAPQIISDLAAIFPPAPGRFLVGPMVQLGWGTPTLLSIELGIVLELPAPVRLLLLGRLKVVLPEPKAPIVRLQLDAVGLIDFASGDVSLDAVLFDSKIAAFTVTGEMALRANFGNRPDMVLAIGGFNPRFQPPSGFPALERVAINLAAGDNPRLRLEAYFALTTNTVQFGALLDLFAKAGPFSIAGMLGLDVLIQLAPFGFVADLGASLALKYNNKSVMSIGLKMTLTGPTPWRAWGKAHYEVLFFSGDIDFDVRIGPAQRPALPPPVNLRPQLVAALRDVDNWSTELPRGEHPLVSLRDQFGAPELLVHPLADLRVTQRIAPFAREINRFGGATPAPYRVFTLGVVGEDGEVRTTPAEGVQEVGEHFAPAQFRRMSDDEKLTAPAFERMQAGIRFATTDYECGPAIVEPEITYARETIYRSHVAPAAPARTALEPAFATVAPDGPEPPAVGEDAFMTAIVSSFAEPSTIRRGDVALTTEFVESVASVGAAAMAPLGRTGSRRFEAPVEPAVSLRAPRFAVVVGRGLDAQIETIPTPDTKPLPGLEVAAIPGYTTAIELLQTRLEDSPEDRGKLHVVPVYEGELG